MSVVIPTWNGRHLLETAMEAVAGQDEAHTLVVVDNGSRDGTAEWVRAVYPAASVMRNEHNLGFATAVNQGILATQTPWIALLNNDAIPERTWLGELLQVGASDPAIGAVASRMMFAEAPEIINSAGISFDVAGGAWDLWAGHVRWPAAPVEVFGASGGAGLFRRTMLEDIGLFDDAFFAYFEDVDLAWRARLRGWRSLLAPAAGVRHSVSATLGEGSAFKRFYLARNKWRVIVRDYPHRGLVRNWPYIVFFDALSTASAVVRRDHGGLRGRRAAASE